MTQEVISEMQDRPWAGDWRVMWAGEGTVGLQALASAGDVVDTGPAVEWFAAKGFVLETATPDARLFQFSR